MSRPLNITMDTIEMQATPGQAFSNGSEWEIWSARWCGACVHDDEAEGGDTYCPLITFAMVEPKTPAQWHDEDGDGRYRCAEYEPREGALDARG